MLWQKEKYPRNPWKISNDLTEKTMRLHENPSKSLSCNCWRKKIWKRSLSLSWFSVLGSLARPFTNYGSKEEILESIFQSSIAKITKSLDGYNLKTDLYQVWIYLFKEVKKEAKIISLAIDYNFERLLTKAVYDFLEKRNGSSSNGAGSYLNSFWSSAIVSVISKWIKDGMKIPAEKIATLGLPLFPQKKK